MLIPRMNEVAGRKFECQTEEKVHEKLVICRDFLRSLCKRGDQCKSDTWSNGSVGLENELNPVENFTSFLSAD